MRKTLFLCWLLTLGLSAMAQIDATDQMNWSIVLDENFDGFGRGWDNRYIETNSNGLPFDTVWRCHYKEFLSGVTLNKNRHQVSQRSNCLFNDGVRFDDNMLRIVSDFVSETPIQCGTYEIPLGICWFTGEQFRCDSTNQWLYYYSGNIETIRAGEIVIDHEFVAPAGSLVTFIASPCPCDSQRDEEPVTCIQNENNLISNDKNKRKE